MCNAYFIFFLGGGGVWSEFFLGGGVLSEFFFGGGGEFYRIFFFFSKEKLN